MLAKRHGPESENRRAFKRLRKALETRNLSALLGAGVSVRSGYPSWGTLIHRLHERARVKAKWSVAEQRTLQEQDDNLWRAEQYRQVLGAIGWRRALRASLHPSPALASRLTDTLVRIPFRHFLTTNYDDSAQLAYVRQRKKEPRVVSWENARDLSEFITRFAEPGFGPCFLHLHGRMRDLDSIVLSDRDYMRRYVSTDEARRKLYAIFATQRMLFIGFSLDDPELIALLREIRATVDSDGPRHFALLSYKRQEAHPSIVRDRLEGKFGVSPIFYNWTKEHTGLDALVNALVPGRRTAIPPIGLDPEPAEPSRGPDPEDPQKGMWGGKSSSNHRRLSATVSDDGGGWYTVGLKVASLRKDRPLRGQVQFHLHDSYEPEIHEIEVEDGVAELEVEAYGAFTVGALVEDDETRLELDLSKLASAPREFRES